MISNDQRQKLKNEGWATFQYGTGPIHSYPYDTPWITDEEFTQQYEKIKASTLVDRVRCYTLYQLVQQANTLPGDILEVGAWRGGTAGLIAQNKADGKTLFIADTFTGVVKSSEWEHYDDKAHADTTRGQVEDLLAGLKAREYKILEGTFPDNTGDDMDTEQLCLVHIDVDVYQSAKDILEFTWPRVVSGGIVVFDDYGFISACEGIYRFVQEIKDDPDKLFIHNLNGQAYLIKR